MVNVRRNQNIFMRNRNIYSDILSELTSTFDNNLISHFDRLAKVATSTRNATTAQILNSVKSCAANMVLFEDRCEIVIAAPNVNTDELVVEYQDDQLRVRGTAMSQLTEKTDGTVLLDELRSVEFERIFTLKASEYDTDSITAAYEDGVLYVSVPRRTTKKEVTVKRISVN